MTAKETHFVMKNERVQYPYVTNKNLQLYYDTKGKHNTDTHKNKLLDMSGNNRHGTLSNFAYDRGSGFSDGLVFDGVDDTLTRPELSGIEIVSGSRNLSPVNTFSSPIEIIVNGGYFSVNRVISYNIKVDPTKEYKAQFTPSNPAYFHTVSAYRTRVPVNESIKDHNSMFSHTRDILDSSGSYITLTTGGSFARTTENESLFAEGEVITFSNIQLEEGSAATPYVPYIPVPKMTYQLNGNIISYDEGGVVRRVQDGQVVERKGINILRNGNFYAGNRGWNSYGSQSGNSKREISNGVAMVKRDPNESGGYGYVFRGIPTNLGDKIYFCGEVNIVSGSGGIQLTNQQPIVNATIDYSKTGMWQRASSMAVANSFGSTDIILHISSDTTSGEVREAEFKNIQVINLTATFGAGNEPTLEQIQAEPEKWAWTPNPMDLMEAKELNGNILGDMEGIIDDLNKDEVSGESPIFTTKADDAVVRVEVDGKSEQDNPPYREVAGESIIVENNEEDKLRKLMLDGKSFQNAGSGKNLFNVRHYVDLEKNIFQSGTYGLTTDNKLIVNRTDSRGSTKSLYKYFVTLEKNTDYTFSADIPMSWRLFLSTEDTESFFNVQSNSKTQTFNSGEYTLLFAKFYPVSIDYPVVVGDLQLEKGSVATAYEPPPPSLDYPIAINSLSNVDVVSSVGKENLLTSNELLMSKNGEEHIMSSESTASPSIFVNKKLPIGIYSYSLKIKKGLGEYQDSGIRVHRDNQSVGYFGRDIPADGMWHSLDITINSENENTVWGSQLYNHAFGAEFTKNISVKEFKIEKTAKSPYTPAPEDIQPDTPTPTIYKTNISLPEPLRSVGDVKDRLFRDSDGQWKVERNVGETILNGSENWTNPSWATYADRDHYEVSLSLLNYGKYRDISSSHFLPSKDSRNPLGTIRLSSDSYLTMSVDKGRFVSVEELKAWIAENNIKIQYSIVSTIETLPPEYQQKLNQLYNLYRQATYFYTLSDIKGTLTAGYKLLPTAEPMTGDILAPTPDYPEEIKSFDKSFDVVSSVNGRNLIKNSNFHAGGIDGWSRNGNSPIAYDENINKHYMATFLGSPHTHGIYQRIELNIGEVYTLSFLAMGISENPNIRVGPDNDRVTLDISDSWKIYSVSFEGKKTHSSAFTLYGSGIRITDIHLQKGSSSNMSQWTPAPEDIPYNTLTNQTYKTSISLAEPLRSVGDVSDRVFRDSDGLWKVERNIGEYVFGRNNKPPSSVSRDDYAVYYMGRNHIKQARMTSSHFPPGGSWPTSPMNTIVRDALNMLGFKVPISRFPTLASFGSWLEEQENKGQPLVAHYQLATPSIEVIPDDLQQKLNNLPSFDGTTYVYTVSGSGMNPHMKAEFLPEDFKKENLTVNSLKIYNRPLENAELLKNYTIEKERFPMGSPREVNPIAETLTLTQGNFVGNTLALDYTLEI